MAEDKTAGGATSPREVEDFERRNLDPTIPIDGADPENIAGPFSNVELEIAAGKHGAYDSSAESTRLRPAHARQKAKSGDAVSDSDAYANPPLMEQVGEDSGEDQRREEGRTNVGPASGRSEQAPEGRTSRSGKQQNASGGSGKQTA